MDVNNTLQENCKSDFIMAIITAINGFLFWEFNLKNGFGLGVLVFTCMIIVETLIYLRSKGYKQGYRAVCSLALLLLFAATFAIFDVSLISFLVFVFIIITYIYWVALFTGNVADKRLSIFIIGDMISACIVVPFSNFIKIYPNMFSKKGKNFKTVLITFIVMIPIVIVILLLLISADLAFENVMDHLFENMSNNVIIYGMEILFGIPVAMYLYGLIYGFSSESRNSHINLNIEEQRKIGKEIKGIPEVAILCALIIVNVIYLLYFAIQINYFLSAFYGQLPSGFTYAQYARRGFFQICLISIINLLLISIASLFGKEIKKISIRCGIGILSFFTILFLLTVISKMVLYINFYGLTQLRIYTTWFTVLLLIIFVIVLIRQIKSFNGFKVGIIAFIICFAILAFGNVDGNIAKYNLQRYEEGTLELMDEYTINGLNSGAIPYIYNTYSKIGDVKDKEKLRKILIDYDRLKMGTGSDGIYYWQSNNYQRIAGLEIVKKVEI